MPTGFGSVACPERYRHLLEQATEGFYILDRCGRCLDANAVGAGMLGLTRAELLGRNLLRHVAQPALVRLSRHELQAGRTVRREKRFRRRDGSLFPGEISARRLADGTIHCVLRDMTEWRRAEQAARTTRSQLRVLFDHSPLGIFVVQVTPEGRFLAETLNPVLERSLQRDRAGVRGRALEEVVAPPLATLLLERLRHCLTTGRPVEYEAQSGAGRVGQVFLFPLQDPGRRVHRIAGFVHDITARHRAESARRESEEKFARIFRVSPDVIAVTDWEHGRLLEVNDSFLRLYGLTRDEFRDRTTVEIGFWPDDATRRRFCAALAEKGMLRDFEMRWQVGGGERIFLLGAERIELNGTPGILTVVTDATAQRRAEEERLATVHRERRAQEDFTRRLLASQEDERRRIAGELHDSLGQELLLIKNRLQLALAGPGLNEELRHQLAAVEAQAVQAIAEVRRISHALRPGQLDHLGLTRALRAMLTAVAPTAGFQLSHRLENVDGVFPPEAEANLYRIVQEGLNNVLKHAHATHVEVVCEHDVHEVRLILADDGRGFAPSAEATEGLGLRNIAERVRILGGRWRLDSAPGTGTRLEIAVPLPGLP